MSPLLHFELYSNFLFHHQQKKVHLHLQVQIRPLLSSTCAFSFSLLNNVFLWTLQGEIQQLPSPRKLCRQLSVHPLFLRQSSMYIDLHRRQLFYFNRTRKPLAVSVISWPSSSWPSRPCFLRSRPSLPGALSTLHVHILILASSKLEDHLVGA